MAYLRVIMGAQKCELYPLQSGKTILGRDPGSDVVLRSETAAGEAAISRKHAIITREADAFYIEDGDGNGKPSRNHTFVNERRAPVGSRLLLKDQDVIRICTWEFVFCEDSISDDVSSINASIDRSSNFTLAQPAEKLRLLLELTRRFGRTLELETLLPDVVQALLQLFLQSDRALLILKDELSGELCCRSLETRRTEDRAHVGYRRDIVVECLSTVQGLLSHEPSPAMCAPLWQVDGRSFGVLLVDSSNARRRFTEDDLNLLMGVATQVSMSLSNASYHRQALAQERLSRDLVLAREVVRSFLPATLPEVPGYSFYASCEPAHEVGGDYYDFVPLALK